MWRRRTVAPVAVAVICAGVALVAPPESARAGADPLCNGSNPGTTVLTAAGSPYLLCGGYDIGQDEALIIDGALGPVRIIPNLPGAGIYVVGQFKTRNTSPTNNVEFESSILPKWAGIQAMPPGVVVLSDVNLVGGGFSLDAASVSLSRVVTDRLAAFYGPDVQVSDSTFAP